MNNRYTPVRQRRMLNNDFVSKSQILKSESKIVQSKHDDLQLEYRFNLCLHVIYSFE